MLENHTYIHTYRRPQAHEMETYFDDVHTYLHAYICREQGFADLIILQIPKMNEYYLTPTEETNKHTHETE